MEPGECTRCGTRAPDGRNSAGECWQCHNLGVQAYRTHRKAQLAAEPRCHCCKRRGTLLVYGATPVCRQHLREAEAILGARMGMLPFSTPPALAVLNILDEIKNRKEQGR